MVTTIDGTEAVRPVCLCGSRISSTIVKRVSLQILCGGHGLPELCKSFLALPESGGSRLLLLCFRGSPRCFSVLAKAIAPLVSPLRVPRVAPPSNPLLQLTFCGTRLRSTGQFRVHFPSLPESFLRLRWGLACPKGDYAWRNMTWQLLAVGPAGMARRFALRKSDAK